MELLPQIESPKDIRDLSYPELRRLAEEIREYIVEVISKQGGHLAPSLGVVELTLALHYCFDTPRDRLIWDVGHQCYAHKIITGRREEFRKIRSRGGPSGFPKRDESVYDPFGTGHSSTSISAGLGMAIARDLQKGSRKVVAVIGDGSMSAGMAFEALNHAGQTETDLVVVLNDNEMCISSTKGALSSYLSRRLADPYYLKIRNEVKRLFKDKPGGDKLVLAVKKAEEALKGFFTPGILFEELGFKYVGPIRGHRVKDLIETFKQVGKAKEPILVHVLTKKGKGYPPAEENPSLFHGIGPFDKETGEPLKSSSLPTYSKVFANTLIKIAQKDERVVAITAAMPDGTGLSAFARRFPDRFFDVGIAEQHAVTFAAGLAAEGMIPVAAIYSTFLQRAYDQIIHDVALQNLPVVFAIDRGGIVGDDGPTHHGVFDLSYLRFIPNMVVMAPSDEAELANMLFTAIKHGGPVAVRYPRGVGLGVDIPEELEPLEIGKGRLIHDGGDVAILSVGNMLRACEEAVALLKEEGITPSLIDARFIKPLDEELIVEAVGKSYLVVTVEENVLAGGFGSGVLELLADRGLLGGDRQVLRFGVPDTFLPHASQDELRRMIGLTPQAIFDAVVKRLG